MVQIIYETNVLTKGFWNLLVKFWEHVRKTPPKTTNNLAPFSGCFAAGRYRILLVKHTGFKQPSLQVMCNLTLRVSAGPLRIFGCPHVPKMSLFIKFPEFSVMRSELNPYRSRHDKFFEAPRLQPQILWYINSVLTCARWKRSGFSSPKLQISTKNLQIVD